MNRNARLQLKSPSGWFAAGQEWQQALAQLSDGAFKLFVYVSLNADRATGRLACCQRSLAQALGKSRRSIRAYLKELEGKQVCRASCSANQHAAGCLQVCPDYWPYRIDEPAGSLGGAHRQRQRYIEVVREALLARPCVRSRFSAADRRLAGQWFDQGIDLANALLAINLGCGRKYVAWLNNGGLGEPIGSLRYFRNILDELSIIGLHSPYHEHCRCQADKLEKRWLETRPAISKSG